MNEDFVTIDTILDWMKEQTQNKRPIATQMWLDAAMKLQILLSDENDAFIELEHRVAVLRGLEKDKGASVSEAKMRIEGTETYREMRQKQLKIKQIEEMVRLAKLFARIKNDEARGNL